MGTTTDVLAMTPGEGATLPAEDVTHIAQAAALGRFCYAVFHLSWVGTTEELRRIVGIFPDRESAEEVCSGESAAAEQFADWPLNFVESFSVAKLPVGSIFNPEAIAIGADEEDGESPDDMPGM